MPIAVRSNEAGSGRIDRNAAPRPFQDLSPSTAPKQHFLTVDLTVKLARPGMELTVFKCLRMLERIEWE